MSSKEQQLLAIIRPAVAALDCDCWGIEYVPQGKHSVLRVYIDKDGGVDVTDCEKVSRQISSVMDVEDPITGQYTLEVSSPGLDRPLFTLAQYQQHLGEQVAIRLTRSFEGRRQFSGMLHAIEADEVVIQIDDEAYVLPFEMIDKARIVPQF